MSSLPFIFRLSRDRYRTLPKRQQGLRKDQENYFLVHTPTKASPRNSDIQDISWLLPLTTLYHYIKEELKQENEEIWRNTHPVKRKKSTRMKHLKDFLLICLMLFNLPLLLLVCPPSKQSFVNPVQEQPLGPSLQTRGTEYRWKMLRNKELGPTVCRTPDWQMANTSSEVQVKRDSCQSC